MPLYLRRLDWRKALQALQPLTRASAGGGEGRRRYEEAGRCRRPPDLEHKQTRERGEGTARSSGENCGRVGQEGNDARGGGRGREGAAGLDPRRCKLSGGRRQR